MRFFLICGGRAKNHKNSAGTHLQGAAATGAGNWFAAVSILGKQALGCSGVMLGAGGNVAWVLLLFRRNLRLF